MRQYYNIIEMQRTQQGFFKIILIRMFLQSSAIPAFLQLIFLTIQFFMFTIFISSRYIDNILYQTESLSFKLIFVLLGIVFFRILIHSNIIRSMYVAYIAWLSLLTIDISSCIDIFLILILLVSDILSKVQYSFCTKNIQSQSINQTKILHYLIMVLSIIIQTNPYIKSILQPYIINAICLSLFAIILLIKSLSIMKNSNIKQYYLRFYLLSCFYFGFNIINYFINLQDIYKNIIVVLSSQILYTIIQLKFKSISVQQYISKGKVTDLTFILMSYLYSKSYNENYQNSIIKFLEGNSEQQSSNFLVQTKQVANKLLSLLRQQTTQELLMKSQLQFYTLGNLIESKRILQRYKQLTSCTSIFDILIIYRLQQNFRTNIQIQYKMLNQKNFAQFLQNQYFRNQLVKIIINYINLWEYLQSQQLIYQKLNYLLNKILKQLFKVKQIYNQLNIICTDTTMNYVNFLYIVQRDVKTARNIHQKLMFNSQFEINLQIDRKIYIKLNIQGQQPLSIMSIGSNICTLLGYQKKQIQGSHHSLLLPQFYREEHKILTNNHLIKGKSYIFMRDTIIKHFNGHYLPCSIKFKMQYLNDSKLQFIGYIHILDNKLYNWTNYVFLTQKTGQILQFSQSIKQVQGNIKKRHANTFFDYYGDDESDDEINKKYIHTVGDTVFEYHPYKTFSASLSGKFKQNIIMFLCLSPFSSISNRSIEQDKKTVTKFSYYNLKNNQKQELNQSNKNLKQFLNKKQSLIIKISGIIQWIFFMILGFLLFTIVAIQIFNLTSVWTNASKRTEAMQKLSNILTNQMVVTSMGIQSNLIYLNYNYNYTNNEYKINLVNQILDLQRTNKYLKDYGTNKYSIINQNQQIVKITTYQIITNIFSQLISLFYVNNTAMRVSALKYVHNNLKVLITDSFHQYQIGIKNQASNISKQNNNIRLSLLIVILFCCTVSYIITIIVQKKYRQDQYQVLKAVSQLGKQTQWYFNTKQFLLKFTADQNYYKSINQKQQNIQQIPLNKKKTDNSTFIAVGGDNISRIKIQNSQREHTMRNLMDQTSRIQDSGRDWFSINGSGSGFRQQQKFKVPQLSIKVQKSTVKQPIEAQMKLRPTSKLVIIGSLLLILTTAGLHTLNWALSSYLKRYSASDATKGLMDLLNQNLQFSNAVAGYLNYIIYPTQNGTYELFNKTLNNSNEAQKKIINFAQINYIEFDKFSQNLQNYKFRYICQYMPCSSKYSSDINIVYSTTIQKITYLMLDQVSNLNQTLLKNITRSRQFSTIIYTENLLKDSMNNLIKSYFDGFKQYNINYTYNQIVLINCTIASISLTIFMFILGIIKIYLQKKRLISIIDLIKSESYIEK